MKDQNGCNVVLTEWESDTNIFPNILAMSNNVKISNLHDLAKNQLTERQRSHLLLY